MRVFVATLLALAVAAPAGAQSSAPASATNAPPCAGPEHHAFDVMIGSWNVTDTTSGTLVGTDEFTSEMLGCVVHEHWHGVKARPGGGGQSFTLYDAVGKRWHQTWVDSGGTLLLIDGGLVGAVMRMRGAIGTQLQEITWTPAADGSVRQVWRTSDDNGATWKPSFDGTYRRKS